jgi:queuine/archaeosine tRNA-ribosyltransferase
MAQIRTAILENRFDDWVKSFYTKQGIQKS